MWAGSLSVDTGGGRRRVVGSATARMTTDVRDRQCVVCGRRGGMHCLGCTVLPESEHILIVCCMDGDALARCSCTDVDGTVVLYVQVFASGMHHKQADCTDTYAFLMLRQWVAQVDGG